MSDLVAECLSLRDWVLPFLTRSRDATEAVETIPRVSAAAWRFFLHAETFAWPLANLLGDAASQLPADFRIALANAAREEVQRIMAARAQLDEIDRVAVLTDVSPVVLKGGVALADGSDGVDLGDIDLLLPDREKKRFGDALENDADYRWTDEHFARDGGVPVEVHSALDVGDGLAPIGSTDDLPFANYGRLRRLSPVSHVLYMIQHSTTKHATRRGQLRDLLLIASALDAALPSERAEIGRKVDASAMRGVYGPTLSLARAMQRDGGVAGVAHDEFRRIAGVKYAIMVWFPRGAPKAMPLMFDHAHHFAASIGDGHRLTIGWLSTSVSPESIWYSDAIANVSVPLARTLAVVARTPFRAAALVGACGVGMFARASYRLRWRSAASDRAREDVA